MVRPAQEIWIDEEATNVRVKNYAATAGRRQNVAPNEKVATYARASNVEICSGEVALPRERRRSSAATLYANNCSNSNGVKILANRHSNLERDRVSNSSSVRSNNRSSDVR